MPTQHIATLLGATCCDRLAVALGFLDDFDHLENVSEMVAETSKDQQSESVTLENSRFVNLSERGLEKILEDKQSNKTKKNTNWWVSTLKCELQT